MTIGETSVRIFSRRLFMSADMFKYNGMLKAVEQILARSMTKLRNGTGIWLFNWAKFFPGLLTGVPSWSV